MMEPLGGLSPIDDPLPMAVKTNHRFNGGLLRFAHCVFLRRQ